MIFKIQSPFGYFHKGIWQNIFCWKVLSEENDVNSIQQLEIDRSQKLLFSDVHLKWETIFFSL